MIREILLRITGPRYRESQIELARILKERMEVRLIDDSDLSARISASLGGFNHIICLSREIGPTKGEGGCIFRYFSISRVFDAQGKAIGWRIPEVSPDFLRMNEIQDLPARMDWQHGGKACVVDTDVATGGTRELALRLFPGAEFFAPIVLKPWQDLIDIEDLFESRSLFFDGQELRKVSYLFNPEFFAHRTSLPIELHEVLSGWQ